MSDKLKNKIALVTGGSSGIGLATAQRFVAEGAEHVYITGRRQAELDAAVKLIGRNVTGVPGDVAKLADVDRLYATVKAKHGRVDVVFANAGTAELASLTHATEAQFDKCFNINVKGVLFTVQKALPLMPDGGSLVLTASVAGGKGSAQFGILGATKAAVRSLARTFATELGARKIRVNVVSPGPIKTPSTAELSGGQAGADAMLAGMAKGIPLARAGEPDEIAKAVVFLASDDASYVNGVELFVDGGMVQV